MCVSGFRFVSTQETEGGHWQISYKISEYPDRLPACAGSLPYSYVYDTLVR